MLLPYLKNKRPRIEKEPPESKLVNADASDHVSDHCAGELMDAIATKDFAKFKQALEALILNLFDWKGEQDVSDEG